METLDSFTGLLVGRLSIKSREKFRVITCFEPEGWIVKP